MPLTLHRACLLLPQSDRTCEMFVDGALVQDQEKILYLGPYTDIPQRLQKKISKVNYSPDSVIMPPLYDMHFHWVQDEVQHMPKDSLLQWLSKYTWPYEAKFQKREFSKKKAKAFRKYLLSVGTLGGACYSSIHGHALEDALKYFEGDFIVGNVLMTMESPQALLQKPKEALKLVKRLMQKYKKRYALTPRFAPTAHPEVMKETGKWAKKYGASVQTHLSETHAEIEYVLGLYQKLWPKNPPKSYTEIYDRVGLLGPKTYLGHGLHLSEKELRLLRKRKSHLIHCPTSNAPVEEQGLGSGGPFDFKRVEAQKVSWVLGSDIGGGPYLSMFDVMDSFVRQNQIAKRKGATYTKALYRSSVHSAEILKLPTFRVGAPASFIVVRALLSKKLLKTTSAEQMLAHLHGAKKKAQGKYTFAPKKSRPDFERLVEQTYYKGRCHYLRNRPG